VSGKEEAPISEKSLFVVAKISITKEVPALILHIYHQLHDGIGSTVFP